MLVRLLNFCVVYFFFGIISAQITVDFSASKTEGCGTLQVVFTDLSTSTAGNIVNWNWDLGGTNSDLQNPGKIFNQAGIFSICLTVTDDAGNTSQACKNNLITLFALPEVIFNGEPLIGCVPLDSKFESQSISPNGQILNYIWGIGGSTGVVEMNNSDPVFTTYNQPDLFTISLTIEDEKGCKNTLAIPDMVNASGVQPIHIYSPDSLSCTNPHAANIQIINPEPDVIYSWDLGNGSIATGVNASTIYTDFRKYDITIFAENITAGCKDTFLFEDFIVLGLDLKMSVNVTSTCEGQGVLFKDASTPLGGNLLWDFGDGNTSNLQNFVHVYSAPGCYDVTLTKTIDGCTSTIQSDTCIEIRPLPEGEIIMDTHGSCQTPAIFNASINANNVTNYRFYGFGDSLLYNSITPTATLTFNEQGVYPIEGWIRDELGCWLILYDTLYVGDLFLQNETQGPSGCAPLSVGNLGDRVSSPFNIIQWEWEIFTTPSQLFTGQNPAFILSDTGSFDLKVVATNDEGCVDSLYLSNYVSAGMEPIIDFVAEPLFGCVDSFVQFTSLASSFANEFFWTFGDGSISILESPSHEYADTGWFDVTFVASHLGCESAATKLDYINVVPPISKFLFNVDCASKRVSFTNNSIGADLYHWDFGVDGIDSDTSNLENPTFQFPTSDIYLVNLTVYNQATGCDDQLEINVDLRGIDVSFQIDTTEGCLPLNFTLTGEGEDIIKWQWKAPGAVIMGDTSQTAKFSFRNRGEFPYVRLIAESKGGCLDTFQFDGPIRVYKPIARFDIIPHLYCAGDTISLIDTSFSLFLPITVWQWSVGNDIYTSNEQFPKFVLDTAGVFPVSLYVEDSLGCSHTAKIDSSILSFQPDPAFSSDTAQCPGLPVAFSAVNNVPGLNYLWDFGDGETSELPIVSHVYNDEGTYTVCLTVSNDAGCDSTICKDNVIDILTPQANFQADVTYANCPPLIVQFENQSFNAITYLWRFGDGTGVSDLKDPGHVYTEPGVYDVFLEAKVSAQCRDTIRKVDFIRLEGPEGEFTMVVDTTCAPLKVEFFGASIDQYNYIWDYGDGQIDSSLLRTFADTSTYFYFSKGTYLPKLILVDNDDCFRSFAAEDSIEVQVSAGAFLTDDMTICKGESTVLSASLVDENADITFAWLPNSALSCEECLNPRVTPDSTSIFYFQTESLNGCVFQDSVIVMVQNLPTIDIQLSKDTTLCLFDTMFIHVNTSLEAPIIKWENHEDIMCLDCDSIAVVPKNSTTYQLTISDSLGCLSDTSITINVLQESQPFAGDDRVICEGDSVFISLPLLSQIQWPQLSIIICDTCAQTILVPTESDCFPVQGINEIGCILKDTICIQVRKKDENEAGPHQVICIGESILLEGRGFGEVLWSPPTGLSNPSEAITDASPTATQIYTISSVEGDCAISDSVEVYVKTKANITATGDSICIDELAEINISGDAEDYVWPTEWFGTLNQIDADHRTLTAGIQTAGIFPIIGYLSSCEPDTSFVEITIYDSVFIDIGEDILDYPAHPVQMHVKSTIPDWYSFSWAPAHLFDCPTCAEPKVAMDSAQWIQATVTDERSGCTSLDSLLFRVLATCDADKFIYIPNIFTPNHDGHNDQWQIFSDVHQEIYSLQVFNRWGSLVWQTDDINASWDGMLNGELLSSGVYVYSLQGPCAIDNTDFILKGTVTLVR